MQTVLRGETIRLRTSFVDLNSAPADPGTVRVDISRPDGAQAAVNLTANILAGNIAEVLWPVPGVTMPGYYSVGWKTSNSGVSPINDTIFEVALLTVQQTAMLVTDVRLRIGERIPSGGAATDTLFSDEEIVATFNREGTFARTVLEMLRSKQAHYATQVDLEESNATRRLSQITAALQSMIARYEALVKQERDDHAASARVPGRTVAWAETSAVVPVAIERVGDVWPTWSYR